MMHNWGLVRIVPPPLLDYRIIASISLRVSNFLIELRHDFAISKLWNKRPKGPLSLTWVQSTLQKFDFGMEPKTTTLHPTCFKITAMHSVCCYNLLGWRSFWNVPPSLMDWPGWQFLFTFRPVKHKLGRGRWELAFCQVRWIPFSSFRGKVENVSANRRTGRLSCFSDQPEKRKPGRGCWDLASCQVLLNSIQRFQRKSWKCLRKS